MKHFYSISSTPGLTGKYYYTEFFKLYSLNADYTPLGVTELQFDNVFSELIAAGASGISISMPFKHCVLKHLTKLDIDCKEYNICNTVVINERQTYGYNCDLAGTKALCDNIEPDDIINILGAGSIGNMFHRYLTKLNYSNVNLYSRSLGNWISRHTPADVIINCTSLGTINSDSPLQSFVTIPKLVIDLSLTPGKLKNQCQDICEYIPGIEYYSYQFLDQFKHYTGISIEREDFFKISSARIT